MVYITQLIYIVDGQQMTFNQFESLAIPLISKYNGKLLFRVRPYENDFITISIEKPYEIHLVEFNTEGDFLDFMEDETRKEFLYLKEKSIKSVWLIKGVRI